MEIEENQQSVAPSDINNMLKNLKIRQAMQLSGSTQHVHAWPSVRQNVIQRKWKPHRIEAALCKETQVEGRIVHPKTIGCSACAFCAKPRYSFQLHDLAGHAELALRC